MPYERGRSDTTSACSNAIIIADSASKAEGGGVSTIATAIKLRKFLMFNSVLVKKTGYSKSSLGHCEKRV